MEYKGPQKRSEDAELMPKNLILSQEQSLYRHLIPAVNSLDKFPYAKEQISDTDLLCQERKSDIREVAAKWEITNLASALSGHRTKINKI